MCEVGEEIFFYLNSKYAQLSSFLKKILFQSELKVIYMQNIVFYLIFIDSQRYFNTSSNWRENTIFVCHDLKTTFLMNYSIIEQFVTSFVVIDKTCNIANRYCSNL